MKYENGSAWATENHMTGSHDSETTPSKYFWFCFSMNNLNVILTIACVGVINELIQHIHFQRGVWGA